ncbi:hypothetical protein PE066_09550 [Ramlibacter tataouinensis]|uniref:hypothetical protein n=1 Tax=Ramlibacter tataouinensis TaxID=94132 RepID=UPI0022F386E8|nr:hypothetical protein [Ramlibacter tataouinensis]WBY03755.1 hypothetical protein PE066_09550 [Ramlibacter tataouinensis]
MHANLPAVRGLDGSSAGQAGAAWTHAQLTPGQREFLRALPLSARVGGALLAHASADDPQAWHYVSHPGRASASLAAAQAAGRLAGAGRARARAAAVLRGP